jgi:hypothetical protein
MQELFDLEADPDEQVNLAEQKPEVVAELKGKLDAGFAKRLQETGALLTRCASRASAAQALALQARRGDWRGRYPLHLRHGAVAASIPDPSELREQHEEGAQNARRRPPRTRRTTRTLAALCTATLRRSRSSQRARRTIGRTPRST